MGWENCTFTIRHTKRLPRRPIPLPGFMILCWADFDPCAHQPALSWQRSDWWATCAGHWCSHHQFWWFVSSDDTAVLRVSHLGLSHSFHPQLPLNRLGYLHYILTRVKIVCNVILRFCCCFNVLGLFSPAVYIGHLQAILRLMQMKTRCNLTSQNRLFFCFDAAIFDRVMDLWSISNKSYFLAYLSLIMESWNSQKSWYPEQ